VRSVTRREDPRGGACIARRGRLWSVRSDEADDDQRMAMTIAESAIIIGGLGRRGRGARQKRWADHREMLAPRSLDHTRRRGRHRRERSMKSRIIEIIAKIKEDPDLRKRIDSRSHLMKDVGLTSLDMMQLFLEIEEEFDIEVDVDAVSLELFESIDRLGEFVAAAVAAKAEARPTA
jgi:acyl carrier protein